MYENLALSENGFLFDALTGNTFSLNKSGSFLLREPFIMFLLKRGKFILQEFERQLEIKVEETTEDGNFSLERVACMGCCMLAPVARIGDRAPAIKIGDKIYSKMTPFKVDEVLVPYKQEIGKEQSEEEQIPQ